MRPRAGPHRRFVIPDLGRASPYGVYYVGQDEAWVSVGTDHDTAASAVESIRRGWTAMEQPLYPDATRLLVTADCGSSNGYRTRLWKRELQRLADETASRSASVTSRPARASGTRLSTVSSAPSARTGGASHW